MKQNQKNRGISLITLIITIIVIIILAAIVIFTGLNTPDRANFAKYVSEFSDFNTAIKQDYLEKKKDYAIAGKTRSDAQIYYAIAKSGDYTGDINNAPTADGSVASLGVTILPEGLTGTDYYEITNDKNVREWKNNKSYYEPRGISGERHFLTDEGEAFMLPGYLVVEDGTNKWYVNERKYYLGERTSVGTLLEEGETNSLEPGLYDMDRNMLYSWEELKANNDIRITDDYITGGNSNMEGILVIDDSVVGVKWGALQGSKLTQIIFPNSIVNIIDHAFSGCNNLEEIVIPDSVQNVDAFNGCSKLKKLVIGKGITAIPSNGFANGSTQIEEIYMSNSVTKIEFYASSAWVFLRDIYFDGTLNEWNNIVISDGNDAMQSATVHCLQDGKIRQASIRTRNGGYVFQDVDSYSSASYNLNPEIVTKLYIKMDPWVPDGDVTIKEKTTGNVVTMPYEVYENGDYSFILSAEGYDDKEVTVNVSNWQ